MGRLASVRKCLDIVDLLAAWTRKEAKPDSIKAGFALKALLLQVAPREAPLMAEPEAPITWGSLTAR